MPNLKELRLQLIMALGARCELCGCTDLSKLQIDHTKRRVGSQGDRTRELLEFANTGLIPDGVRVLCRKCNIAEFWKQQQSVKA
jgi:predicted nucleic-acid-binding Zn-ribbon protein